MATSRVRFDILNEVLPDGRLVRDVVRDAYGSGPDLYRLRVLKPDGGYRLLYSPEGRAAAVNCSTP